MLHALDVSLDEQCVYVSRGFVLIQCVWMYLGALYLGVNRDCDSKCSSETYSSSRSSDSNVECRDVRASNVVCRSAPPQAMW